jgi:CPA1 family monovalent cation:H+ antiporter
VVSVLVPLAERFRLPHTVLLAIAGMGMGFLGSWIIAAEFKLGALGDVFIGLDKLEVGTDVFLPLFLPPLLFTAGLTIDVRRLMDEIHAVLLLAVMAVRCASPAWPASSISPPVWISSSACCSARSCRPRTSGGQISPRSRQRLSSAPRRSLLSDAVAIARSVCSSAS